MNTNCLEGIKCPDCGNDGPFTVSVRGWAVLTDDGLQSVQDADWEDDSMTYCARCSKEGPWESFKIPKAKARARAILDEFNALQAEYEKSVAEDQREKYQLQASGNVQAMVYALATILEELVNEGANDD
jgi:hypothetical protein